MIDNQQKLFESEKSLLKEEEDLLTQKKALENLLKTLAISS